MATATMVMATMKTWVTVPAMATGIAATARITRIVMTTVLAMAMVMVVGRARTIVITSGITGRRQREEQC
ncbi:hypothetical protein BJX63DRAFT_393355 [Aspergillus granulosus]|uniref:Secreted peptide n=1 Tax=Aspergillus granulosus TaxID=176169 RepID=A0ABR4HGC4_9EURO